MIGEDKPKQVQERAMEIKVSSPGKEVTFKTGLDSSDSPRAPFSPRAASPSSELRLPPEVNFVALRETLLSEAPFVKRANRNFWKKWIDSKQYYNVLSSTLMIVADSVADNGNILMKRMYELQEDNPFVLRMAKNISEMMVMDRSAGSRSHDSFFGRLPELLCYMITNSLLSMAPKSSRVFYSVKFREILIDWLSELIYGIRITNSRFDREWLFKDANDVPILVVDSNVAFSFTPARPSRNTDGDDSPVFTPISPASSISRGGGRKRSGSAFFAGTGYSAVTGGKPGSTGSPFPSMVTNTNMMGSSSGGATGGGNGATMLTSTTNQRQPLPAIQTRYSSAQAVQTLGNSPLIRLSMNQDRQGRNEPPYVCNHALRMTMSSMPERDLFPIQDRMRETTLAATAQTTVSLGATGGSTRATSANFHSTNGGTTTNMTPFSATSSSRPSSAQPTRTSGVKEGPHMKFRERKMDHDRLLQTISSTYHHRKDILLDKDKISKDHKKGMYQLNHALKLQLGILEKQFKKKKITQQELLAEANAVERARFKPKETDGVGNGGGGGGGGDLNKKAS